MFSDYSFSESKVINQEALIAIEKLQQICVEDSAIAFKFELAYKMAGQSDHERALNETSEMSSFSLEYFCHFNGELVGYLGVVPFGGRAELMGMVHPKHRRKGIFKALLSRAFEVLQEQNFKNCLLLSDRNSQSGQALMKAEGFLYESSEYEMKRKTHTIEVTDEFELQGLNLRLATNADALEISKQNAVYFNCPQSDVPELLPEEEARRGMHVYIAEMNGKVVGKIHLQEESDTGWIYGLGVMPEFRGLGYGRGLLIKAVKQFREQGLENAALQVAVENETALSLYLLSGFQKESIMDYYVATFIS